MLTKQPNCLIPKGHGEAGVPAWKLTNKTTEWPFTWQPINQSILSVSLIGHPSTYDSISYALIGSSDFRCKERKVEWVRHFERQHFVQREKLSLQIYFSNLYIIVFIKYII